MGKHKKITVWKISNIASVPKVHPRSTIEDFRPIALTSVPSKIQESYVMDWVLEDIRDRISDSQFGGLAGMSAVTALLLISCYTSGINGNCDRRELLKSFSLISERLSISLITTGYWRISLILESMCNWLVCIIFKRAISNSSLSGGTIRKDDD